MKILFPPRARLLASLILALMLTPAQAETVDPTSAKSIAKPILMLMLYCHSALDTLAGEVAKDPKPSAVDVSEKKWQAIRIIFEQYKIELGACALRLGAPVRRRRSRKSFFKITLFKKTT